MKHKFLLSMVVFFIIIFAQNLFAQEKVTIKGDVEAVEWDDDANIVSVAIVVRETLDEMDDEGNPVVTTDYYYVIMNDKGTELIELVDKSLEVTGVIGYDDDEYATIDVSSYKIIDE